MSLAGGVIRAGLLALIPVSLTAEAIDYAGLFEKGIVYEDFLRAARSRRDEWLTRSRDAKIEADAVARVRDITGRRRLLVIAEDWCGDSSNTLPYLAKLIEAAPDHLELRVVSSSAGREVIEAHRTPDGRAATPTVVVLDEDGQLLGAWIERPSVLQTWFLEHENTLGRKELFDLKYKWYEDDQGKSTVREIVELLRAKR